MKTTFASRTKHLFACVVLLTAGLLASSCEREGNKIDSAGSNTISLNRVGGGGQDRIKSANPKKAKKLLKREKLTWVADITAPAERKDLLWSASSVVVKPGNDGRNNIVYITWHSNRQATNPSTAWGGAIDIVDMTGVPTLAGTYVSEEAKFNHALPVGQRLFLSATSAHCGGAVARIELGAEGKEIIGAGHVALIGFPGNSVNAVAPYDGKLVAVSGYKGTYATFDADMEPMEYDYFKPAANLITPLTETLDGFGGKYVIAENGHAYVLYDAGEGAVIADMDGNEIKTGVHLASARKFTETYNENTGEWELSGEQSDRFGKHTMAVKGNHAYVACGKNGLIGVDLTTGAKFHSQNLMTVGLCIHENRLFAVTGMGLRVYDIMEDGSLELYAFEVESYDETTGAPVSEKPAGIETPVRHSPNFVTYDPVSGYIYVAYGQSGVRVYKFTPEEPEIGIDMGGSVLWAPENLPGYYAWGEIFSIDDPADFELTFDRETYYNNGTYYPRTGRNKLLDDHKNFDGYRFFNGEKKLTKYTWKSELDADGRPVSEDGRTILEAMDDVAAVRLGEGWRMPTEEEWKELLALVQETSSVDGRTGVLFKAENGNELFLPQTGYYGWRNTLYWTDSCYYWSASLSTKTSYNKWEGRDMPGGECQAPATFGQMNNIWCTEAKAVCMVAPLNGRAPYMHLHDRCCGMSIRPVKDKK